MTLTKPVSQGLEDLCLMLKIAGLIPGRGIRIIVSEHASLMSGIALKSVLSFRLGNT